MIDDPPDPILYPIRFQHRLEINGPFHLHLARYESPPNQAPRVVIWYK